MSRDAYACKLTMHFPTLDNLPRSLYIGNRRKPNLAAFRWGPHRKCGLRHSWAP